MSSKRWEWRAATKFDEIVEQVFAIQLTGRGKTPEEREKILRKLSGIKEAPKKKEKEKKPAKAAEKRTRSGCSAAAKQSHGTAAGKAAIKAQHKAHGAAGKQRQARAPRAHGKSAARRKRAAAASSWMTARSQSPNLWPMPVGNVRLRVAILSREIYNRVPWVNRSSFIFTFTPITACSTALAKPRSFLTRRRGRKCPRWPSPTTATCLPRRIFSMRRASATLSPSSGARSTSRKAAGTIAAKRQTRGNGQDRGEAEPPAGAAAITWCCCANRWRVITT